MTKAPKNLPQSIGSWDKQPTEKLLADFLQTKTTEAAAIDSIYQDLLQQISHLVARGGKRVRPYLVELAYLGYNGSQNELITYMCASQELFHAFILMHDDVIDRDYTRWNGPNIAGHYKKQFAGRLSQKDAHHFSNSWALLAGDICFGLANELMCNAGFDPAKTMRAVKLVQQTLFAMIGGELVDTALSITVKPNQPITINRLLNICYYKTATYSFCTPLKLGAICAGAADSELHVLEQFGHALGIAFQLRDDIIDMYSDEIVLGKPSGSDLKEGKQTLLIHYGFLLASVSERKALNKLYRNASLSSKDFDEARHILRRCGALNKVEVLMRYYHQQALQHLSATTMQPAATKYLRQLAEFCVQREK